MKMGCRYVEVVTSFPLGMYPEVGLQDHRAVLFLILKGTSTLFSTVAAPIYILISSAQGFPFLHILPSTCSLLSFW